MKILNYNSRSANFDFSDRRLRERKNKRRVISSLVETIIVVGQEILKHIVAL